MATKLNQFRQVTIKPAHSNGVWPFTWGTVGFAIALLIALWGTNAGVFAEKWLWVFVAGIAVGVSGLGYCIWRRGQRRRLAEQAIAPETP